MRVVHVPIEAHVQHAIAVEKRDWSILATTRKRAQRVRNGPVHAAPSPHRPLRLATALLRWISTRRVEDRRERGSIMAGASVESIGLLALGMVLLGVSLSKRGSLHRVSLIAWPLVGLGFFLMADGYWQERDPV